MIIMKSNQLTVWGAALFLSTTLGMSEIRADWVVDNNHSRVAFVSTKAGNVAEVHRFGQLSGALSKIGEFTLDIALDSVDTNIEIRDERLREMLFQTERYPRAQLVSRLDMTQLQAIGSGGQGTITTEAQLNLHGQGTTLTINAAVARLDDGSLLVSSDEPLVITAGQFGLQEGIERLRDIAGLPSISPAVPVTFRLTLRPSDTPASSAP